MIKEYIKVQLNELIPHARNPRKNDGAVEAVSKSIKETGYITPIIVDENNEILCGHTRAKSLKKLGHSEVEVLKVTGLTDEQKKRYRILDNKTGEVAEWDFEILGQDFTLTELSEMGFDLDDKLDALIDGETLHIEKSLQVIPKKEYIIIMADEESEEWSELKRIFKCKMVRQGGCTIGSTSDKVGTGLERVFDLKTFKERVLNV